MNREIVFDSAAVIVNPAHTPSGPPPEKLKSYEELTMQKRNDSEELEISIFDLLSAIWDLRLIVIALIIAGGVVGMLFSAGGTTVYETKASMLITARNAVGTYRGGAEYPVREEILLAEDLTKTVRLLASSDRVLTQVIENISKNSDIDGITIEQLRQAVEVKAETGTSFLWLTLRWDDSELAAEILNGLMDILPEIMLEVMDIGSVSVIDRAREGAVVSSNGFKTAGVGIVAGALAGCMLGVCYYLFVPKIRNNDMLERLGLDVIGTIPSVFENGETVLGYLDTEGLPVDYKEAFGRLTAVLRYQAEKEKTQIIAVTSSLEGEGKSAVVYNLALSLAQLGCKVLLLDFDFQKSILYQLAKTRKEKDGDVRREPRDGEHLEQLLEQMNNGIYTIQGFAQKKLFQIDNDIFPALREMKTRFDYILIDTPPVGTLSDIQQMRGLMDGVLLVVQQNRTTSVQVEQAVDFLEKTGIRILGCVVNGKEKR